MSTTSAGLEIGFSSFDFRPEIRRGIAAAGFERPRQIQADAIPPSLAGRDILGLARTGTGKTAAFALPLLEKLLAAPGPGPRALIVAPTRELATQICAEITLLAQFTKIRCVTVFGGVSERPQIAALRKRPEIVVACPGRLLDLVRQGVAKLDRVSTLVLDEADHMFDMGFLPDVRRILAALPKRRQNLLFSATMPAAIRGLALEVLDDPHLVDLTENTPPLMIEHAIYPVVERDKRELLARLLAARDFTSAIVFTRTKHRAKRLALQLSKDGHRAIALQGNMSQNARERAMEGFKNRQYDVLVATDIAARGIDVERVSHVVNFDMPNTTEAYTHRVGRTGRSGHDGKACTLVTADDQAMVRDVERAIGAPIPRRKIDGVGVIEFADRQPSASRSTPAGGQRNGARQHQAGGQRDGSRQQQAGGRRDGERRHEAGAGRTSSGRGRPQGAAKQRRRHETGPGRGSVLDAGSPRPGAAATAPEESGAARPQPRRRRRRRLRSR